MKLPIKKKYFDLIKSGEKIQEYRDAHITFVCEETGESIVCDVVGCWLDTSDADMMVKYPDCTWEDGEIIIFNIEQMDDFHGGK